MFELPSVKEIIEKHFIHLNQADNEDALAAVYLNDPFAVLVEAFKQYPAVAVKDSYGQTLGCITSEQIIGFLHDSYNQLKAFYETVIDTMDASVTVVDADERVRTWTQGAEKIFSVKKDEIMGKPIIEFFEHKNLEILESLHKGKRIRGKYHQARSNLFVLINANPVYFNESIIGAVVSETDVTSQVVLNEKLFNMSTEVRRLEQEMAKYKPSDPFNSIKGKSTVMEKTVQLAKKVCTVRSTVLILGESGVGKEVFAKAIHETTEGANAPFRIIRLTR
ncbi:sigma 54-interacting transcriptional regulator [Neobacillus sp. KR4-4]|uniref:sigma 54-interacting transcriptional regulator n=1 Tax=Neobacillus sp. KR4-4 TaxID=3344872 RepID=UPI0035CA69DD